MSDVPTEAAAAHIVKIATETGIHVNSVASTAKLLAEGATVPFISRYRKEATGSLDEVQIQAIRDRMVQLAELDGRRTAILKSLEERNLLSDELKKKLGNADTIAKLEDIFAPFRPKRQTRATKAREKGLEPLADWLLENQKADPAEEAANISPPKRKWPMPPRPSPEHATSSPNAWPMMPTSVAACVASTRRKPPFPRA